MPATSPAYQHLGPFSDLVAFVRRYIVLSPDQALAVALYEVGGVRSCEIGTVMFGRQPDGRELPARFDLVRLAIPRRVYTQSHADYLVEVFEEIARARSRLPGYRIVQEPKLMRHFTAQFARL